MSEGRRREGDEGRFPPGHRWDRPCSVERRPVGSAIKSLACGTVLPVETLTTLGGRAQFLDGGDRAAQGRVLETAAPSPVPALGTEVQSRCPQGPEGGGGRHPSEGGQSPRCAGECL